MPIKVIPLTTNGKLDVKALPPPTRFQRGVSRLMSRGASTELSSAVRAAFEKALGLTKGQVGVLGDVGFGVKGRLPPHVAWCVYGAQLGCSCGV